MDGALWKSKKIPSWHTTWESFVLDEEVGAHRWTEALAHPPAPTVRPVRTNAEIKEFIGVPWQIYRGDDAWRPTLRRVMRAKMDPRKNPLHSEVQIANFVAYRQGRPVGRISACIDSHYVQRYGDYAFFDFRERAGSGHRIDAVDHRRELGARARHERDHRPIQLHVTRGRRATHFRI